MHVLLDRKVAHSRSLKTYRPVLQSHCVLVQAFGTVGVRDREREFEKGCSLGIKSSARRPFVTLP